jgi:hypothetical protein
MYPYHDSRRAVRVLRLEDANPDRSLETTWYRSSYNRARYHDSGLTPYGRRG